jgi:hypothetical protein
MKTTPITSQPNSKSENPEGVREGAPAARSDDRAPLLVVPERTMPPMPENATKAQMDAWLWECWCRRNLLGSGT